MKKILNLLNSKYFLTVVIGLSILVIIIGVLMVKNANEQAVIYAEKQKVIAAHTSVEEESTTDIVKQFEQLAASAQTELEASKPENTQPLENIDFVSAETRKKVAEMVDKNPEIGSEDWCEVLMVRPGRDWSEQDHQDFAKHCLD